MYTTLYNFKHPMGNSPWNLTARKLEQPWTSIFSSLTSITDSNKTITLSVTPSHHKHLLIPNIQSVDLQPWLHPHPFTMLVENIVKGGKMSSMGSGEWENRGNNSHSTKGNFHIASVTYKSCFQLMMLFKRHQFNFLVPPNRRAGSLLVLFSGTK